MGNQFSGGLICSGTFENSNAQPSAESARTDAPPQQQLAMVVAKQALQNAARLRQIEGVFFMVYEISANDVGVFAVREVGQKNAARAKEARGQGKVHKPTLPMACYNCLAFLEAYKKKTIQEVWSKCAKKIRDKKDLSPGNIKHFRVIKCYNRTRAKVQFNFDAEDNGGKNNGKNA